MAYAYLGRCYDALGESELAAQNIAKAYELRDRVSDWENYFITFNYHRQVTRNLELARQTLESWAQKYPEDLDASRTSCRPSRRRALGHYEKAVEEGQKAIELDPDFAIGYVNVAWAYVYLNRLSEAEALLRKASERKIEVIQFSLCRYFIAFLRNDQAAMEREMTQRQGKTRSPGMVRAPGSSDVGVSGAPERSGPAIGARGEPGSPGRFAGAGRHVCKALAPCGMRCSGFARRRKEARRRRCRFTEAGTPIMGLPLRWRFCATPRKLTRSRRTSKSATRRIHPSNSVTCLRCGRSKLSTRVTRRKRSK